MATMFLLLVSWCTRVALIGGLNQKRFSVFALSAIDTTRINFKFHIQYSAPMNDVCNCRGSIVAIVTSLQQDAVCDHHIVITIVITKVIIIVITIETTSSD